MKQVCIYAAVTPEAPLHGRIADEVEALKAIGMNSTDALGPRVGTPGWLGRPGLTTGATADLVCFNDDPRGGPGVLSNPDLVILRGGVC